MGRISKWVFGVIGYVNQCRSMNRCRLGLMAKRCCNFWTSLAYIVWIFESMGRTHPHWLVACHGSFYLPLLHQDSLLCTAETFPDGSRNGVPKMDAFPNSNDDHFPTVNPHIQICAYPQLPRHERSQGRPWLREQVPPGKDRATVLGAIDIPELGRVGYGHVFQKFDGDKTDFTTWFGKHPRLFGGTRDQRPFDGTHSDDTLENIHN